jgi:hypothetical protein
MCAAISVHSRFEVFTKAPGTGSKLAVETAEGVAHPFAEESPNRGISNFVQKKDLRGRSS